MTSVRDLPNSHGIDFFIVKASKEDVFVWTSKILDVEDATRLRDDHKMTGKALYGWMTKGFELFSKTSGLPLGSVMDLKEAVDSLPKMVHSPPQPSHPLWTPQPQPFVNQFFLTQTSGLSQPPQFNSSPLSWSYSTSPGPTQDDGPQPFQESSETSRAGQIEIPKSSKKRGSSDPPSDPEEDIRPPKKKRRAAPVKEVKTRTDPNNHCENCTIPLTHILTTDKEKCHYFCANCQLEYYRCISCGRIRQNQLAKVDNKTKYKIKPHCRERDCQLPLVLEVTPRLHLIPNARLKIKCTHPVKSISCGGSTANCAPLVPADNGFNYQTINPVVYYGTANVDVSVGLQFGPVPCGAFQWISPPTKDDMAIDPTTLIFDEASHIESAWARFDTTFLDLGDHVNIETSTSPMLSQFHNFRQSQLEPFHSSSSCYSRGLDMSLRYFQHYTLLEDGCLHSMNGIDILQESRFRLLFSCARKFVHSRLSLLKKLFEMRVSEVNIDQWISSLKSYNINMYDKHEMTPLSWCVLMQLPVAVKKLLDAGADPNDPNIYGETPLHFAYETGNEEIKSLLLDSRADAEKLNFFGESVTAYFKKNEEEVVCFDCLLDEILCYCDLKPEGICNCNNKFLPIDDSSPYQIDFNFPFRNKGNHFYDMTIRQNIQTFRQQNINFALAAQLYETQYQKIKSLTEKDSVFDSPYYGLTEMTKQDWETVYSKTTSFIRNSNFDLKEANGPRCIFTLHIRFSNGEVRNISLSSHSTVKDLITQLSKETQNLVLLNENCFFCESDLTQLNEIFDISSEQFFFLFDKSDHKQACSIQLVSSEPILESTKTIQDTKKQLEGNIQKGVVKCSTCKLVFVSNSPFHYICCENITCQEWFCKTCKSSKCEVPEHQRPKDEKEELAEKYEYGNLHSPRGRTSGFLLKKINEPGRHEIAYDDEYVRRIKKRIEDREGLSDIKLSSGNVELEDDKLYGDYKLQFQTVVFLTTPQQEKMTSEKLITLIEDQLTEALFERCPTCPKNSKFKEKIRKDNSTVMSCRFHGVWCLYCGKSIPKGKSDHGCPTFLQDDQSLITDALVIKGNTANKINLAVAMWYRFNAIRLLSKKRREFPENEKKNFDQKYEKIPSNKKEIGSEGILLKEISLKEIQEYLLRFNK